jgi:hypothetical protein
MVGGHSSRSYMLSARVCVASDGPEWWLTTVYGPVREANKPAFLAELHELCLLCSGSWMLTGDFNLIYCTEDKNNNMLNRCLMGQF